MQQRFYQTMNKNCKLLYSIAFYFTKRMLVVYYVMKARSHVLILLKIFLNLKGWNSEIDLKKESSDISKWKLLKGKLYHSYAKIKTYSCTSFHDSNQISVKRCAAKIEFLFFPLCIRAYDTFFNFRAFCTLFLKLFIPWKISLKTFILYLYGILCFTYFPLKGNTMYLFFCSVYSTIFFHANKKTLTNIYSWLCESSFLIKRHGKI